MNDATMQQLQFIAKGTLEWREVPRPVIDGNDQVLVRPLAVARCDLDLPNFRGETLLRPPFPIGHEFVGEIVARSEDLEAQNRFAPGERVIVPFQVSCGSCPQCSAKLTRNCETTGALNIGLGRPTRDFGGALQNLLRIPYAAHMLVALPDSIDPIGIASISDNIVEAWKMIGRHLERVDHAWQAQPERPANEKRVLIAGGFAASIGLYCVALAKTLGAGEIVYADHDRERLEHAQKLGASQLIELDAATDGTPRFPKEFGRFAIAADASGSEAGFQAALRSLEGDGVCTGASIFWSNKVPIPFLDLYNRGGRPEIERVRSREWIPEILRLIQERDFAPGEVVTRTADWKDAAEAMLEPATKLVVRGPA